MSNEDKGADQQQLPLEADRVRSHRKTGQLNRLHLTQMVKAIDWVRKVTFNPGETRKTLADRATEALGFKVTDGNIITILEGAGVQLPGIAPRADRSSSKELAELRQRVDAIEEVLTKLLPEHDNCFELLIVVAQAMLLTNAVRPGQNKPRPDQMREAQARINQIAEALKNGDKLPVTFEKPNGRG